MYNTKKEVAIMKIGYQGVPGAYSEMACIQVFPREKHVGFEDFPTLMKAVEDEAVDYALIPIENSTTGIIYRTMDLLRYNQLIADYETYVKIDHCLISIHGNRVDQIQEVYSHPEALSQCLNLFKEQTNLNALSYRDTADSVALVKKLNIHTAGAIASKRAAEIYKLEILEEGVQDNKTNTTRFLAFRKNTDSFVQGNKVTLYFETSHEAGGLVKVLNVLGNHEINMLDIQSRPLQDSLFKYGFFVELDGRLDDLIMKEIKSSTSYLKIIGSYNKGHMPTNDSQ